MADLGNLKILLDMATTGNLKSTLENVDKRLDKMREKAASLQLGFDDKSVSALSTKMRDIADSMQEVSRNAGTKMAEGMAKSAEATKSTTTQMQQQVALSADLEAGFKELLGVVRSIAEAQKGVNKEVEDGKEKKKKAYDLERLHQLAIEKDGQLAKDQVAVWGQMEALLKSMVGIDEKYTSELYKQLEAAMEVGGVTREQLGSLRNLAIEAQRRALEDKKAAQEQEKAARKQEQAARKQKQAAKERETARKQEYALGTQLINIDKQLIGVDQSRLREQTKLLLVKKQNGTISQEEATRLSALLSQEKAILNAERQKGEVTKQTNTHLAKQSALLSQIKSYLATYVSVIGAANLIRNLVRITGEFEAQHVALRAILQDVAGADRIFYQLQELAVKSPFTFRNLTDYAKQLSAFSVPMNEIYDTTKRLADVSAGLGVDMSRIILAYGQIRSASFLRGQEVRQLTEAGIPVLQELSKQFKEIEGEAVSVGKVFDKISARQVPFEMIEKMFRDLTSEGGKFYQMQETLAETVKGKVSNLQDAWEIMLSKVGEDNSGFIKGVLDGVTNLIKNYKELAKAIELAAIAYGTYRAAALAATQAESMQRIVHLATGKNIKAIPALLSKITIGLRNIPGSIAGIVSKLNPWAIGIAAVTTAVAALVMRNREMNAHIRETHKLTNEAIAKAEATKSNIEYYIKQMKDAKEGTEEYNKARQAVIDNSGSYISATDAERLSLQNVDDVWVNICKHIEEATKLQAMQSVSAKAEADRQEKQLDIMRRIREYANNHDLTSAEYNYIIDRVKGNKTYEDFYRSDLAQKGRVFQNTEAWKREFDAAKRIHDESMRIAQQDLNALYGSGKSPAPAAPQPLTGWRLSAQQYLDTFNGKTRGVKITEETNLADLAENGAKSLNELRKALELIPNTEADYKAVENDIKFWEKLSEAIYGSGNTEFNNSTKLTKKQSKDAETLRKEQIAAIKQSVQDLKEAKRWYDQLTPLLGSDNAKTLLASFNFAVPKEGFGAAFQGYSDKLKALGDKNGARDVMNWANGREVGDVLAAAKAVEKYTEALKDFEAQTKRLNLSGFAQELDKIIVDADSKNRQLETNWAQKAEELEKAKDGWIQRYRVENEKATADDAEKAWKAFYDNQVAMAKKSIDTQREYNNKVAQEAINKKADEWVKVMLEDADIQLTDWGDKTIDQVEEIQRRLQKLLDDGVTIPEALQEDAKLLGITFDELLDKIKKLLQLKKDDTDVELDKKRVKQMKEYAKKIGEAASKMKSFADSAKKAGEAMNVKALTDFADALSGVADAASESSDGFSKMFEMYEKASKTNNGAGNWFSNMFESGADAGFAGAMVAFTIWMNKKVLELAAIDEAFEKRQAAAIRSARNVGRMQGETKTSIFGSDDLSQTLSDMEKLDKIRASMEKYQSKVDEQSGTTQTYSFWHKLLGWMNPENWSGKSVFSGELLPDQVYKISDLISNLGLQLYDEYGNLNAESLQQLLNTYETLTDEERAWIEQAIQDSKDYAEVMGQLTNYLESIFGQVGDSIADSLITAFEDTGQAAFDTGDILSEVARNFIKDWTKAFLMKNYLNNLTKSVNKVWDDASLDADEKISQSVGLLRDTLASMSDELPIIQKYYQEFEDQFHWADGAGEELGDAIKTAMVEQNSSLMAGYLNSIRADVTMNRNEIMRSISPAVTSISNGFNTHLQYMESVAGNVANIWNRLNLLTSSGSGVKINARM